MLTELINFTNVLTDDFKSLGVVPKEGLHILLQVDEKGNIKTYDNSIQYAFYSKKMKENYDALLDQCKQLQENAWCVNTNKCFDLPMKAIQSCSPFCIAFKREHIYGGAKHKANLENGKSQIGERFGDYFSKTKSMLPDNQLVHKINDNFESLFVNEGWNVIFNDIENQRLAKYQLLSQKEELLSQQIKTISNAANKEILKERLKNVQNEMLSSQVLSDSDYILFYLNLPVNVYKETHARYLDDKLFNTDKFNTKPNENGIIYGTNDFQNGYNANMPFLLHQTASFDITGRISNLEARTLYEFSKILPRRTLPNPLPIFIYNDEFNREVIALYKNGKLGFRDLTETLYSSHKEDFSNYYLLNWSNTQNGIVFNDFDFVSKFEYEIDQIGGLPVENYFNLYQKVEKDKKTNQLKFYQPIQTVFELEDRVLKYLIQNKYHRVDYFSDFKKEDYDNYDLTFLSFCKYRKAVYDFVYKSNRNTITGLQFDEMVFNSIRDDFKNNNEYGIKEKLNYWYSLYEYFHKPKKNIKMASKLKDYQDFVAKIAINEGNLSEASDKHFAFAAGQIIEYLINKSEVEKKNYQLLEPYLQKSKCDELKIAIANDAARYKHAINQNEIRFKNVFAAVETWQTDKNVKDLLPELLSGIFSKPQFYNLEYNKNKNN